MKKVNLGGHSLGGEGEADSDGGEETLGHVGHDDADQEDHGVEPVVAEDEGDDEEGDSEEDGDGGDDVDEVLDLLGNRGLTSLKTGGKTSNSAHHLKKVFMMKENNLFDSQCCRQC